jgi:hypothetical protein
MNIMVGFNLKPDNNPLIISSVYISGDTLREYAEVISRSMRFGRGARRFRGHLGE